MGISESEIRHPQSFPHDPLLVSNRDGTRGLERMGRFVVLSTLSVLPVARFLFHLQSIHNRCQLAQDLVCFLVEFQLSGDEIGEVAERFRGIEDL